MAIASKHISSLIYFIAGIYVYIYVQWVVGLCRDGSIFEYFPSLFSYSKSS